uniref:Zeaxanthin epoxidase, chloroplastic n=1 Tax=Oncidium hybrid cultivar TaxID=141207 RepID=ZEP_ONCHC|nr:RecName: Full=Zeaxanthin epoxidase, chloroplastic; Short=OgZEP; Flags: Precursor [Oncidium hybrid cultivar]ACP27627.1 zeaxanthin epoxidase [Oncidium hybrid cultivar]
MLLFRATLLPSPPFFHKTYFSHLSPVIFSDDPLPVSLQRNRVSGCRKQKWRQIRTLALQSDTLSEVRSAPPELNVERNKFRILIAGGGIGGLVLALAAKKKGFDALVFEKDMSAIRGEGQYRGPIQIQSNALAALEAIDSQVAEEVMGTGCITGDRINGLVDGVSGTWYIKFDTFTPAAERGLPVTRVISRMSLQQILARAVGDDAILSDSKIVDFVDYGNKVAVILENGQQYEGDLLVGADGIWSKVREILFGYSEPSYSGYTCYTGIADFVPPDIDTVGYRVFLGHKQYFVSSDVGAGKMQWYAFHNEPPSGSDVPNGKKEILLKIFNGWCDNVIDLINATEEELILRRDIYDRIPIFTWGKGRVTLLGDSVHAMQPNMGQGGCMAIEDSYQLAHELEKARKESIQSRKPMDVKSALKRYEKERRLRVAVIYGMARMAAIMASTYRPYLGVGLGPLSFLTKYKIPHPGRTSGRLVIKYAMPLMLSWVLGGNSSKLEGRSLTCRLSDKASDQLRKWFEDDDALERALGGEWYLFPLNNGDIQPIRLVRDDKRFHIIGSISHDDSEGISIHLPFPQVHKTHARIACKDNIFYLTDLQSQYGTWITDNEGRRYQAPPNVPVRFRSSYSIEFGSDKKVVFKVKVLSTSHKSAVYGGQNLSPVV